MRKTANMILALIIILFTVTACNQNPKESRIDSNCGFLQIQLPINTDRTSRELLNSQAAAVADVYGVVIWDINEIPENYAAYESEVIYTEIGSSTDLISLPVGNYKVLVLAGALNNGTASLCGSGSASSVLIEENKTTTVSITLAAPTLEIDYIAEKNTIYTSDSAPLFSIHFETNDGYLELGALGYVYDFNGTKIKNTSTFRSHLGLNTLTYENKVPDAPGMYSYGYAGSYQNKLHITDQSLTSYISDEQLASYYNKTRDWILGPIGVESYDALFEAHQFEVKQRPNSINVQLVWAED